MPFTNPMNTMKTRKHELLLAALLALTSACNAASPEDGIKTSIERFTEGKVKAEKVTPTPAKGIWQVQSEGEIFYVDASGRYGIVGGRMVDMSAKKDMTEQALAALHAVPFDSLPLDMAASKQVNGNGQRRIAIFEDPGCPVCRAFVPFADQLDNVTIYRFPLPITSQQSLQVTRNAWCSTNRAASWDAVMHGGQTQGVQEQCDISGLETILRFAEQHRIENTPTVFLENGKRLVGATPPEQFLEELEAASKPQQ